MQELFTPGDESLGSIARFQLREHRAGSLVELQPSDGAVVYIAGGRVLATTVDRAGRETLCMHRGAGSMLGLEALDGLELPYLIWTLTDVRLATTTAGQLREWLGKQPAASRVLFAKVLGAARRSLGERMALHGSATARVARFLLAASDGVGPAAIMPNLPRNVMARMLAMRPETLSRVLRKLEQVGVITLEPEIGVVSRRQLVDIVSD